MAGRPSFRGRMGVEDGKNGEQDRAEMSRGTGPKERRTWGEKPNDGVVSVTGGPDSKHGGSEYSGSRSSFSDTTSGGAERSERGTGPWPEGVSPPNTVPMPIMARGESAPGNYDTTGDKLDLRGSLGNTRQAAYNDRPGQGNSSDGGFRGEILGRYKSNFYNKVGQGHNDGEGDSGSGEDTYTRHKKIEGFGGGKSTFQSFSEDYNNLGDKGAIVGHDDGEGDSGSGPINSAMGGGRPKAVKGFSNDGGLKNGMI